MIEKINTSSAPAAIGPYSQAVIMDDILFTSGQIPIDVFKGTVVGDDIKTQTKQVMKNIGEILNASGASFESTVKTTCYLKDMNDFPTFNKIYAEFFIGCPARSCVAVKALPKDVLVEVEAIARIIHAQK